MKTVDITFCSEASTKDGGTYEGPTIESIIKEVDDDCNSIDSLGELYPVTIYQEKLYQGGCEVSHTNLSNDDIDILAQYLYQINDNDVDIEVITKALRVTSR